MRLTNCIWNAAPLRWSLVNRCDKCELMVPLSYRRVHAALCAQYLADNCDGNRFRHQCKRVQDVQNGWYTAIKAAPEQLSIIICNAMRGWFGFYDLSEAEGILVAHLLNKFASLHDVCCALTLALESAPAKTPDAARAWQLSSAILRILMSQSNDLVAANV